ncbi:hypothetical protein T484DRAFT_3631099 [Baffinella frigidus]|nr:hypothetical protein T484DRAFT_3631099 [Cryptophyta sp. CCMP2293]
MDDLENAIQNALVFPDELATTDRKTKGPIELGLRPSFDLRENEDGYVVSCFTPGLKKEDLHAEVVGTDAFPVLVVRGESKKEDGTPPDAKDAEDGKEKTSFFRTKYQKFEQRMSLPADVDQHQAQVQLHHQLMMLLGLGLLMMQLDLGLMLLLGPGHLRGRVQCNRQRASWHPHR